jgi:ribosomal protein S18 acetylase RimI-like enzyme
MSSFFQATMSPTLAWIGSGENLKFLIVAVTVAAAPAGATAHAAAELAAAELAAAELTAELAAELANDGAVEAAPAALDDAVGAAPPEQAASAMAARPLARIRLRCRIALVLPLGRGRRGKAVLVQMQNLTRAPRARFWRLSFPSMTGRGDLVRSGEPRAARTSSPRALTAADARWLAWHEARSHGLIGREVRDLGDAVLLHDPTDREPFWNRLAGIAWPSDAAAFDRRLAEALALFASLDRIPHMWPMTGFDEPPDLVERLLANGFEDHGRGMLMLLDPERAVTNVEPPAGLARLTIERLHRLAGVDAAAAATAISEVLVASFAVSPERRVAIELEALQGLELDAYHAVLVRVDGQPAAVARRTSLAGASYLSSIGTHPAFRGRGLGRLVTSLTVADSLADGDRWTYLGVFEENTVARAMYDELGFTIVGGPSPDMLLRP